MELQQMINEWKKARKPEIFEKIFSALKPIVYKHISKFTGSGLPKDALELEARKLVAEALEKYMPLKGKPEAYIDAYLQGLGRFTNKYQAIFRLPENLSLEYKTFEKVKQDLTLKLDREPSAVELADALGWPIERVRTYLRRNISLEDFEAPGVVVHKSDSLILSEARAYIANKYGRDAEKLLTMVKGLDGQPMSLAEAARKLKLNYYSARNILKKIEKDFQDYLSTGRYQLGDI